MSNKFRVIMAFALTMLMSVASAQTMQDTCRVIKNRLRYVDFINVNVGGEVAANINYEISPKVALGIGSFRNVVNGDVGLKIKFCNPLLINKNVGISYISLPIFISANINIYKWKFNSLFVGGEIDYNISLTSILKNRLSNETIVDKYLIQNHFSAAGKLGCKLNNILLYLFYEYDIEPAYNQKYIFESANYDYYVLKKSIFERWRFGVNLSYMFNL